MIKRKENIVFAIIALLILVIMPILSLDHGVSGDEKVDHKHTEYVIDYFLKGDKSAIDQPKTHLHLYGINTQVITRVFIDIFNIKNHYETRHIFCSLWGFLTILFTGLLARRLKNNTAGIIAMLLLFLSPRFLGHSMNNLKDIPFAFGYIFTIYQIIKLYDNYPLISWKRAVCVAVGIGFTVGGRVGGVMLIPYFALYTIYIYIKTAETKKTLSIIENRAVITKLTITIVLTSIVGIALSYPLWPYAIENPTTALQESLTTMSNFKVTIKQIFEGAQINSHLLPWYYPIKYLLIGNSLVLIIGALLYILRSHKKDLNSLSWFIIFVTIAPIIWIIYKGSNLYGGIRHLLFIIPIVAVMAAVGWSKILSINFKKTYRYLIKGLFTLLIISPTVWIIRSYPNEYIYFNELVGGIDGAYGNYELDYYFNSAKGSAEWLKQNRLSNRDSLIADGVDPDKQIIIATHSQEEVAYQLRDLYNCKVIYTRYYNKDRVDWDYAIFVNTYINIDQLKNESYPPSGTIHSIKVKENPISVILKRESRENLLGLNKHSKRDYKGAIDSYNNYLSIDSTSALIWTKRAEALLSIRSYNEAQKSITKALKLYPNMLQALNTSANIYAAEKKYDKALSVINRSIKINYTIDISHIIKSEIYRSQQKYKKAFEALKYASTKIGRTDKLNSQLCKVTFESKNYKTTIDVATNWLNSYKDQKYRRNILIYLYQSHNKIGNREEAAKYRSMIKKQI